MSSKNNLIQQKGDQDFCGGKKVEIPIPVRLNVKHEFSWKTNCNTKVSNK